MCPTTRAVLSLLVVTCGGLFDVRVQGFRPLLFPVVPPKQQQQQHGRLEKMASRGVGFGPRRATRGRRFFLVRAQTQQQEQPVLPKAAKETAAESDAVELLRMAAELRREAHEMERQLSRDAESDLDTFFDIADVNHDGHVTAIELRAALLKQLVETNADADDAAKASMLLENPARVESVLHDLDANHDGTLERDEWVSVKEFRERLERAVRDEDSLSKASSHPAVRKSRRATKRVELYENHANQTGAVVRAVAAACYALPVLEVAHLASSLPVGVSAETQTDVAPMMMLAPVVQAVVDASLLYKHVPLSGFVAFFVLFNVAIEYKVPRLVRFSARHALVLDLLAAFCAPVFAQALLPYLEQYSGIVPAFFVCGAAFVCAVAALKDGRQADFLPLTGSLVDQWTKETDREVIELIENFTNPDDDDDDDAVMRDAKVDDLFSGGGASKNKHASGERKTTTRASSSPLEEKKTKSHANNLVAGWLDAFYEQAGIDRPDKKKTTKPDATKGADTEDKED